MQNFQDKLSNKHEDIVRFSNLNQCTCIEDIAFFKNYNISKGQNNTSLITSEASTADVLQKKLTVRNF